MAVIVQTTWVQALTLTHLPRLPENHKESENIFFQRKFTFSLPLMLKCWLLTTKCRPRIDISISCFGLFIGRWRRVMDGPACKCKQKEKFKCVFFTISFFSWIVKNLWRWKMRNMEVSTSRARERKKSSSRVQTQWQRKAPKSLKPWIITWTLSLRGVRRWVSRFKSLHISLMHRETSWQLSLHNSNFFTLCSVIEYEKVLIVLRVTWWRRLCVMFEKEREGNLNLLACWIRIKILSSMDSFELDGKVCLERTFLIWHISIRECWSRVWMPPRLFRNSKIHLRA